MEEELTAAKEFWLALAQNDRVGAQVVVNRLDTPLVESAAFSFEEVEVEGGPRGQYRCVVPQDSYL